MQLPDAASLERTQKVVDRITELVTPIRYKLDDEALAALPRAQDVPPAVLAKLDDLLHRRFETKEVFEEKVAELLSAEELQEYKTEVGERTPERERKVWSSRPESPGSRSPSTPTVPILAQFFISFEGFEKRPRSVDVRQRHR